MWIRIQDQRLKDSQIVEYKGRKLWHTLKRMLLND